MPPYQSEEPHLAQRSTPLTDALKAHNTLVVPIVAKRLPHRVANWVYYKGRKVVEVKNLIKY